MEVGAALIDGIWDSPGDGERRSMSVRRAANCPIWRCRPKMAAVRVSSGESALAAAGDVVAVVSGWGKKGGGAPGALLVANAADGAVLGCAVAAAAAEMPAAVAAGMEALGIELDIFDTRLSEGERRRA